MEAYQRTKPKGMLGYEMTCKKTCLQFFAVGKSLKKKSNFILHNQFLHGDVVPLHFHTLEILTRK